MLIFDAVGLQIRLNDNRQKTFQVFFIITKS